MLVHFVYILVYINVCMYTHTHTYLCIGTFKHRRDTHSFPELLLTTQLCQLTVEKKAEVDSMLEVLQTKQKELQSGEYLYSILKGKKRKAVLEAASEKKKSEINLIKDATDSELGSSDSEEAPQKVCRL